MKALIPQRQWLVIGEKAGCETQLHLVLEGDMQRYKAWLQRLGYTVTVERDEVTE